MGYFSCSKTTSTFPVWWGMALFCAKVLYKATPAMLGKSCSSSSKQEMTDHKFVSIEERENQRRKRRSRGKKWSLTLLGLMHGGREDFHPPVGCRIPGGELFQHTTKRAHVPIVRSGNTLRFIERRNLDRHCFPSTIFSS